MIKRFYAVVIFLFALATIAPAHASQDSVFTVKDIKVDVTAESAATAQKQAFFKAQTLAFSELTKRILSDKELSSFTPPDSQYISTLVKDYEITEEQLSSVRYIGTYTFRFKSDEIKQLLTAQNIHFTDVSSKPVLVLPFFQWGPDTLLWHAQNPFLAAWKRINSYQGLVPIVIPIGDIDDVSDLGTGEALSYNHEKLAAMANRYQAGETIILVATPYWPSDAVFDAGQISTPSYIDIAMYRTDRGAPEFSQSLQIRARDNDTIDTLFDRAVANVRNTLQAAWKDRTVVDPSYGNMLKVRVRFNSMKEWIDTQNALKRVQGINDMQILSLTPNQASLELAFQGSAQRLRLALSQADMTLSTPTLQFGSPYLNTTAYNAAGSPLVYDLFLNKYKKSY